MLWNRKKSRYHKIAVNMWVAVFSATYTNYGKKRQKKDVSLFDSWRWNKGQSYLSLYSIENKKVDNWKSEVKIKKV